MKKQERQDIKPYDTNIALAAFGFLIARRISGWTRHGVIGLGIVVERCCVVHLGWDARRTVVVAK